MFNEYTQTVVCVCILTIVLNPLSSQKLNVLFFILEYFNNFLFALQFNCIIIYFNSINKLLEL